MSETTQPTPPSPPIQLTREQLEEIRGTTEELYKFAVKFSRTKLLVGISIAVICMIFALHSATPMVQFFYVCGAAISGWLYMIVQAPVDKAKETAEATIEVAKIGQQTAILTLNAHSASGTESNA